MGWMMARRRFGRLLPYRPQLGCGASGSDRKGPSARDFRGADLRCGAEAVLGRWPPGGRQFLVSAGTSAV